MKFINSSQWTSGILMLKLLLVCATTVPIYVFLEYLFRFQPLGAVIRELGKLVLSLLITMVVLAFFNYYVKLATRFKTDPTGKAVLITGCDSGFGFETALRLYCSGYHVYAGCLDLHINGAVTLLKADGGKRLIPVALDVTDQNQVDSSYDFISSHLKQNQLELWAVINNAGVSAFCELEFCSLETYRHVLDINTLGTVRVTKRFLPLLRESQGRLIIISSLAGHLSYAGLSAYCMSKHAIVAIADCLRKEIQKWNISVSTIESTGYRTQMLSATKLSREMDQNWNEAPPDVRHAYGNDYFLNFRKHYIGRLTAVNPNIGEAVDTIVNVVETRHPKNQYFTCVKGQLRYIAKILPTDWQDLYMTLFESFAPVISCLFGSNPSAVVHIDRILFPDHENGDDISLEKTSNNPNNITLDRPRGNSQHDLLADSAARLSTVNLLTC